MELTERLALPGYLALPDPAERQEVPVEPVAAGALVVREDRAGVVVPVEQGARAVPAVLADGPRRLNQPDEREATNGEG